MIRIIASLFCIAFLIAFGPDSAFAQVDSVADGADKRVPKGEFSFAPSGSGFKFRSPEFVYDVSPLGKIKMGNRTLSLGEFRVQAAGPGERSDRWVLIVPRFLLGEDVRVRALTDAGRETWSTVADSDDFEVSASKAIDSGARSGPKLMELEVSSRSWRGLGPTDTVRFCLSRKESDFESEACTPLVRPGKTGPVDVHPPKKDALSVSINGFDKDPAGIVILNAANPIITFAVTFPNGATLKLVTSPRAPVVDDVSYNPRKKTIRLAGSGARPLSRESPQSDGRWTLSIAEDSPGIPFAGTGSVPFTFPFSLERLPPTDSERPRVVGEVPRVTYARRLQLTIENRAGSSASTTQGTVETDASGALIWTLEKLAAGKINRRSLLLSRRGEGSSSAPVEATYEIFRAFAGEVGIHAGFSGTENGILSFAQATGEYWFETIGGWRNPELSLHRWGVRGRYLRNVSQAEPFTNLSRAELDLAFRLIPGVKDEDLGLGFLANYTDFAYNSDPLKTIGAGAFISAEMPRLIDGALNVIPFFRAPKTISAEYLFHFLALGNSRLSGAGNSSFSLKGRIRYTPRFYVEAGATYLTFSFVVPSKDQNRTDISHTGSTVLGFLGAGFNF